MIDNKLQFGRETETVPKKTAARVLSNYVGLAGIRLVSILPL